MEPFVNIFFAIDEQQNETITRDELRRYVKHNHLDEGMITVDNLFSKKIVLFIINVLKLLTF